MPVNIPVIINVDVQQTDVANGQIFVRWTKPLAGGINLDTIQNPPPYRFDLYRGSGFNLTNPQLIISTPDAASFSALNRYYLYRHWFEHTGRCLELQSAFLF
jgi:hypothetical protein